VIKICSLAEKSYFLAKSFVFRLENIKIRLIILLSGWLILILAASLLFVGRTRKTLRNYFAFHLFVSWRPGNHYYKPTPRLVFGD